MLRSRARNWRKEKRMITGYFLFASIRCFCIRPIVQGVCATPEMRCRHISNRNFYYPVREQEFSFVHYAFHAYKFTMICLELQEKLTTLQCECMRFADYVMNLTQNRNTQAILFDDEYLNMAAQRVFDAFGRIPNPDPEEIIKALKK